MPGIGPRGFVATSFAVGLLVLGWLVPARLCSDDTDAVHYETVRQLLSEDRQQRRAAESALIRAGDRSMMPGLVDTMFFIPVAQRDGIVEVLEALTGEKLGRRYYDWVEWVGAHPEIEPREGYAAFKVGLLERIDERYRHVFYPGAPSRIRLAEIVWGGVRIGGIPALVEPATIAAVEAKYLRDDERVFGASVNGQHRAYPLRILDWHEMLNDTLGGEPVALSYCTLCGSGILYHTRTPQGEPHIFGTSGLLYRSNKLMIDERSLSLWSNLTGEPVVGRLAGSETRLPILPMTLTSWEEWRRLHPDTTVLDLEPLKREHDFRYLPGAADRARAGVSFPVWQKDTRLERADEVYALRLGGRAKAYLLEALLEARLVNDSVGSVPVVLLGDPNSGSVRAYERGERSFRLRGDDRLVDDRGVVWRLTEEALISEGDAPQERLARQPGHVSFWFGWYGFYPDTELWTD